MGGGTVPTRKHSYTPGLQTVWDHLIPLLGPHKRVTGSTIRDWLLSLTKEAQGYPVNCQCFLRTACFGCGQSRCGFRHCNTFYEPCGTCQTIPISTDLEPPPKSTKGKRKIIAPSLSLNLHTVGMHFVESITGIEEIPTKALVDPGPPEREERPLTDIRFRVSMD